MISIARFFYNNLHFMHCIFMYDIKCVVVEINFIHSFVYINTKQYTYVYYYVVRRYLIKGMPKPFKCFGIFRCTIMSLHVIYYNKHLILYMYSHFTVICSHLISQDRKLYTC